MCLSCGFVKAAEWLADPAPHPAIQEFDGNPAEFFGNMPCGNNRHPD